MNDSTIAGAQQQPEQQQLLTTTQALMVVSVISIPAAARLPTCLPLAAMWQRPVVLLLLFLMLPLRISAVDMDDWPEHFCGNQLTKELDKICNGSYASISDTAINDQPLDNNSPYAYKSSPLVAGGGDAEPDRQRRELVRWYMRQGIVKECCQQMCSRRVLRTYCKTDQQATGRSP